ncbi:MAG: family 1 encapsulin nanocompartment shell protein [Campylobacterota bacterium]
MEFLNRVNAPFGSAVWNEIDSTLNEFLTKRLNIRSVIDFNENYDYNDDAISTKAITEVSNKKGLSISTREPIKMLEIKKSFTVPKTVIEDIKRGIEDYDDSTLADAANEFATVENDMVLNGLSEANIKGIISNKEVPNINISSSKEILSGVAKSLGVFNKNFVDGKFKLIISNNTLASLYTQFFDGISVKTKIDDILGAGNIVVNKDIGDKKALLVSQRGGDFELFSGLDVSLGFEKENKDNIELFLMQTCAFRVVGPEGAVILNIK